MTARNLMAGHVTAGHAMVRYADSEPCVNLAFTFFQRGLGFASPPATLVFEDDLAGFLDT